MNVKNMVHVATIIVSENNFECMYEGLSSAVAPLGVYLLPVIQEANYQKTLKPDGVMKVADFISMIVETYKQFESDIFIETALELNEIRVYASKLCFKKSTYASPDFIQKVHNSELPVIFGNKQNIN